VVEEKARISHVESTKKQIEIGHEEVPKRNERIVTHSDAYQIEESHVRSPTVQKRLSRALPLERISPIAPS
jgi:hypothetical protein